MSTTTSALDLVRARCVAVEATAEVRVAVLTTPTSVTPPLVCGTALTVVVAVKEAKTAAWECETVDWGCILVDLVSVIARARVVVSETSSPRRSRRAMEEAFGCVMQRTNVMVCRGNVGAGVYVSVRVRGTTAQWSTEGLKHLCVHSHVFAFRVWAYHGK